MAQIHGRLIRGLVHPFGCVRGRYAAARVPAHPLLRLSCELPSHCQTGALPPTAHRSRYRVAAAASRLPSTAGCHHRNREQPMPPLRYRHDDPGWNPSPVPISRSAAIGHLMRRLPISPPIHEDAAIAATHARSVRAPRRHDTLQPVRRPFSRILWCETGADVPFSPSRRKDLDLTEAIRSHRSPRPRHSKRITERFSAV